MWCRDTCIVLMELYAKKRTCDPRYLTLGIGVNFEIPTFNESLT